MTLAALAAVASVAFAMPLVTVSKASALIRAAIVRVRVAMWAARPALTQLPFRGPSSLAQQERPSSLAQQHLNLITRPT